MSAFGFRGLRFRALLAVCFFAILFFQSGEALGFNGNQAGRSYSNYGQISPVGRFLLQASSNATMSQVDTDLANAEQYYAPVPVERTVGSILARTRGFDRPVIRLALNGSRLPAEFQDPPSADYLFSVFWNGIPAAALGVLASITMIVLLSLRCCGLCRNKQPQGFTRSQRYLPVGFLGLTFLLMIAGVTLALLGNSAVNYGLRNGSTAFNNVTSQLSQRITNIETQLHALQGEVFGGSNSSSLAQDLQDTAQQIPDAVTAIADTLPSLRLSLQRAEASVQNITAELDSTRTLLAQLPPGTAPITAEQVPQVPADFLSRLMVARGVVNQVSVQIGTAATVLQTFVQQVPDVVQAELNTVSQQVVGLVNGSIGVLRSFETFVNDTVGTAQPYINQVDYYETVRYAVTITVVALVAFFIAAGFLFSFWQACGLQGIPRSWSFTMALGVAILFFVVCAGFGAYFSTAVLVSDTCDDFVPTLLDRLPESVSPILLPVVRCGPNGNVFQVLNSSQYFNVSQLLQLAPGGLQLPPAFQALTPENFQGPITAVQSAATADLTQAVNPGEVDAAVSQIQQQSAAWTAADFQGNEQALQSARQQAAAAVQSLQSIRVQLGALMQEQTLAFNLTNDIRQFLSTAQTAVNSLTTNVSLSPDGLGPLQSNLDSIYAQGECDWVARAYNSVYYWACNDVRGGTNALWLGFLLLMLCMVPAYILGLIGQDRYGIKYSALDESPFSLQSAESESPLSRRNPGKVPLYASPQSL